ncbi:MAG: molybdopterin-synthase adenylyltransferase MoeB, partial [Tolumonas sp.]
MLTDEEFLRYGRQILLPEIGEVGQARLKKSKVLI